MSDIYPHHEPSRAIRLVARLALALLCLSSTPVPAKMPPPEKTLARVMSLGFDGRYTLRCGDGAEHVLEIDKEGQPQVDGKQLLGLANPGEVSFTWEQKEDSNFGGLLEIETAPQASAYITYSSVGATGMELARIGVGSRDKLLFSLPVLKAKDNTCTLLPGQKPPRFPDVQEVARLFTMLAQKVRVHCDASQGQWHAQAAADGSNWTYKNSSYEETVTVNAGGQVTQNDVPFMDVATDTLEIIDRQAFRPAVGLGELPPFELMEQTVRTIGSSSSDLGFDGDGRLRELNSGSSVEGYMSKLRCRP